MLLELHLLQNFAPSNLNRDDTGSPKDCEFGGYRRARISSQCQKRAIRIAFAAEQLLPQANLAVRTTRLTDALTEQLVSAGRDGETARRVVEAAVRGVGLRLKDGRTEYLLFLGRDEMEAITAVCEAHWDSLASATADTKASKKEAKAAIPRSVADALVIALDGRRAADLALFGRMLADLPDRNREAACQVAHALSTNAVSVEFDFFTAIDDLKPPSNDARAAMLGTIEFNSSCYYRYANIDLCGLLRNLGNDVELAWATVRAFIQSAVTAVPSGKQNTFAAHNPPSLVMGVLRSGAPWSLANAFVRPVTPRGERDLIAESIAALDDYWGRLTAMYGDGGIVTQPLCLDAAYGDALHHLASQTVPSVATLIDRVDEAIDANGAWG